MACCIAIALFVSFMRGAWFLITGTRPTEVGFAPPARRPAPNATLADLPPSSTAPHDPRPSATTPHVGRQLIVVGLSWFGIGVVGMHFLGWFDWAHTSLVVDVVFHSSGIWLATCGAALLAFQRHSLTEVTV